MDYEKLKAHFDQVAGTESGQVVFKWIKDYCGFQSPTRVLDPATGEVSLVSTACNAAINDVWLTLRQHIATDKLIYIEYNHKTPEPIKVEGDLDGRPKTSDSSAEPNSASSGGRYSRRDIHAESERFANDYLKRLTASSDGST